MTTRGDSLDRLTEAVRALHAAVAGSSYPLPVEGASTASEAATSVLAQLDDYVLPRLERLDAPLLVGVGGPTGAGKSTTVNSMIRAPASAAGVLRPTTRAPVLVCNPADAGWFRSGPLLAGMTRTSGHSSEADHLQLVTAPAMSAGCAFLDTPDIDSVVASNRDTAMKLLAAADLWLFVTTASRYADVVPWELLQTAQSRGTTVAFLLNRVPADATEEVTGQVTELLTSRGLATVPVFVLPETRIDGSGLLPESVVAPLREWFDSLAADERARTTVINRTLDGAIAALPSAARQLAAAIDDQLTAADALAEAVGVAYGTARATVEQGVRDGTLLRGEAGSRWREFVATGEWKRARLGGRGRARLPARGRPQAGRELVAAIQAGVVSLVRSAMGEAAEQTHREWRGHSAGATLLTTRPETATLAAADDQASRLAHQWRRDVLALVEGDVKNGSGRFSGAAHVARATSALVLAAAVAPTGQPEAGDPSHAHEQVLAAALADPAIAAHATKAREDLLARVGVLLDTEAAQFLDQLAGVSLEGEPARLLREAASTLEQARVDAALTSRSGNRAGGAGGARKEAKR